MDETIAISPDRNDESRILTLLNSIRAKFPQLQMSKPVSGQVSGEPLITFNVPKAKLEMTVEKLLINNVPIVTYDKNLTELVKKVESGIAKGGGGFSSDTGKKVKRASITHADLEKMAESGKFDKISEIAVSGSKYEMDVIEKAKSLLAPAAKNFIDKSEIWASQNIERAAQVVGKLHRICASPLLRNAGNLAAGRSAGIALINISKNYVSLTEELIDVANDSSLDTLTNLRAAAALGEAVLMKADKFPTTMKKISKNLNIRFLRTAADVSIDDLSESERKYFEDIIKFVADDRGM